jgi:hypothetical protein
VAKDPRHSPVDIAKKNAAEEEAVEEARKLYKHYIVGNDKVTNPQRVDCRLPVYDKIPTHVVLPHTWVKNNATGRAAKPRPIFDE